MDIASQIVEYLEEEVDFPDVDMCQRLSLGRGFKVVEIPVPKKSKFGGQSIEEARLLEQEIQESVPLSSHRSQPATRLRKPTHLLCNLSFLHPVYIFPYSIRVSFS